jgi:UDP-glucuronate 4-epimerase
MNSQSIQSYFITGTAGFIGYHTAIRILKDGHIVHGYDAMTDYYDTGLKKNRLDELKAFDNYHHTQERLEDFTALMTAATKAKPDIIIHLAGQAGVRYSLENPKSYIDSNIVGSFHVLEVARLLQPRHLMLASSSSVYGANEKSPFEETDKTDEPLTLYAASKKSMEVMAHSYAHLWKIPTTCFRFFTVYGPSGRPDMAPIKFAKAAFDNEAIEVYAMGQQQRDFTYVDDLIESIMRLAPIAPSEANRQSPDVNETLSRKGPFRIINLGGGQPIELMAFIEAMEEAIGEPIKKTMLPAQKGDVPHTHASPNLLQSLTGFKPITPLKVGLNSFISWYRSTRN